MLSKEVVQNLYYLSKKNIQEYRISKNGFLQVKLDNHWSVLKNGKFCLKNVKDVVIYDNDYFKIKYLNEEKQEKRKVVYKNKTIFENADNMFRFLNGDIYVRFKDGLNLYRDGVCILENKQDVFSFNDGSYGFQEAGIWHFYNKNHETISQNEIVLHHPVDKKEEESCFKIFFNELDGFGLLENNNLIIKGCDYITQYADRNILLKQDGLFLTLDLNKINKEIQEIDLSFKSDDPDFKNWLMKVKEVIQEIEKNLINKTPSPCFENMLASKSLKITTSNFPYNLPQFKYLISPQVLTFIKNYCEKKSSVIEKVYAKGSLVHGSIATLSDIDNLKIKTHYELDIEEKIKLVDGLEKPLQALGIERLYKTRDNNYNFVSHYDFTDTKYEIFPNMEIIRPTSYEDWLQKTLNLGKDYWEDGVLDQCWVDRIFARVPEFLFIKNKEEIKKCRK